MPGAISYRVYERIGTTYVKVAKVTASKTTLRINNLRGGIHYLIVRPRYPDWEGPATNELEVKLQ